MFVRSHMPYHMTWNTAMKTVKTKTSKWTALRLIASGALLGVAVAGLVGVDTSSLLNAAFGASGAVIAAAALKVVHIL